MHILSFWLAQSIWTLSIKALYNAFTGFSEESSEYAPITCAQEVASTYGLLVRYQWAPKFLSKERSRIDSTFFSIIRATESKISSSPWLDGSAKRAFISRLRGIRATLWPEVSDFEGLYNLYSRFPKLAPTFFHYWVTTREQLQQMIGTENRQKILRYPTRFSGDLYHYEYMLNSIVMKLPSMAAPFYYTKGTHSMIYGGVGFLYAKEVVRSFDQVAVCSSREWNVSVLRMSKDSEGMYTEKTFCRPSIPRKSPCVSGWREDGSIFPEVPALEVTYAAYQEAVSASRELSPINRRSCTAEQMFFITICRATCRSGEYQATSEVCNIAVKSFEPFSKAFNCGACSKMNPSRKCGLFK